MPEFDVSFRKISTGRINKKTMKASNENALREVFSKQYDVGEILKISKAPPAPATDRQIDYLRALGVERYADLTKHEASDLIGNVLEKRTPGNGQDRSLAEFYGVEITRFASKATIFRNIRYALLDRVGNEELAQWYVYRVYRSGYERFSAPGIRDPQHEEISQIAKDLSADPQAMRSLLKCARSSSCDFRWFGKIVTPERNVLYGESTQTAAYRFAYSKLNSSGLLDGSSVRRSQREFVTGPTDFAPEAKSSVVARSGRDWSTAAVLICAAVAIFLIIATSS